MKNIYKLVGVSILFCFSTSLKAQTAGTLTFTFTDAAQTSSFQQSSSLPNTHTLIVWIENTGTAGTKTCASETTHVTTAQTTTAHNGALYATYLRYCCGGSTSDHEPQWKLLNGSTTATLATGGISSTTLGNSTATTGSIVKTITWNVPTTVPDGLYRVCIEKAWDHGTSGIEQRYFQFNKNGTAVTYTGIANTAAPTPTADDASFKNITLKWTPSTAANEQFSNEEMAVIYPNPSKGFFNIDFKTDVKNVKVLNTLGQVVYNEEITDQAVTTKKVDLSNLNGGEYIVIVSNETGQSSYKVILDK